MLAFLLSLFMACLEGDYLVNLDLAFSGTCLTFMHQVTLLGSVSELSTGGSFSSCTAAKRATYKT